MTQPTEPRINAYGWRHQQRREELLPAAIGQRCAMCGYEMRIGQALDLDHSDLEAKGRGEPGDRIVHTACNRSIGAKVNTPKRRARLTSRDRICVICGTPYYAGYAGQRACSMACGRELRRRNQPPRATPKREKVSVTCPECGGQFLSTTKSSRIVCSTECRAVRDRRQAAEHYQAKRPVPQPRPCEDCGVQLQPRETGQGPQARYCPACRRARTPSGAAQRRRRRQREQGSGGQEL